MKTELKITGLHCDSCKALIEDAVKDIPGVTSCSVDLWTGLAVIEHAETVGPGALVKEIEGLGQYKAETV